MDYLLDTHVLIWAMFDSDKLPVEIKKIIEDYNNNIFVSVGSLWEIEIKHQKYPEQIPYSAQDLAEAMFFSNYTILEITEEDIFQLSNIAKDNIHKDPFDHVLLATAKNNKLTLITHDHKLEKYQDIKTLIF